MTEIEKDARTWGMLCHLTGLALLLGIPFGNILGPLVVWLLKKEEHPFIDEQGKESLNFQISISIYFIIAAILVVIVVGLLILIPLFIAYLVLVIIASIKASNGESYRYPLTIKFIQ
ncbi:MAG: DUF4870 domain-containing protein [Candidatus Syntrophonatronum acetioxidans]|uniref:DUF4870 domain-containing protein n=1 Tax=Candidatus Syntrophonatronum acetioxidans TaxID=1795816 RepID=A0A424YGE5_9FIRM|nr:MAG: DUF4870 domain-containing protein [Candidatus Syntrophonatronum acetioxidans]